MSGRGEAGAGQPRSGGGAKRGGRPDGARSSRPAGGRGGRSEGGRGGRGGRGDGARGGRRDGIDETVAELAKPLAKVLNRLPETQRKVLELRMGLVDGHPHDLSDTARALGLSMSEARDIEKRAFEHIREAVPLHQLQRFLDR